MTPELDGKPFPLPPDQARGKLIMGRTPKPDRPIGRRYQPFLIWLSRIFTRKPKLRRRGHSILGWERHVDGTYHNGESVIYRAGSAWERHDVSGYTDERPIISRHHTLHAAIDAESAPTPLFESLPEVDEFDNFDIAMAVIQRPNWPTPE